MDFRNIPLAARIVPKEIAFSLVGTKVVVIRRVLWFSELSIENHIHRESRPLETNIVQILHFLSLDVVRNLNSRIFYRMSSHFNPKGTSKAELTLSSIMYEAWTDWLVRA